MMRLFSIDAASSSGVRRPMPSISSMNITQGAFSRAVLKSFLTLEMPLPRNLSLKSLPTIAMNAEPDSPASAFANSVLPVPGGPASSTPRAGCALTFR